MTFDDCLDFVIAHEGGDKITNDPNDPGGLTKYGIAQASHPGVDVANLTREGAAEIYRAQYWNHCRCDELPAGLRLAVFDAAVNAGTRNAVLLLQKAVDVQADGEIGPQTLVAAQRAQRALPALLSERIVFYVSRGGFGRYGRGWIRRCLDLQETVLTKEG